MNEQLRRYVREVDAGYQRLEPSVEFKRQEMVARHRQERATLAADQAVRWNGETARRAERLPKGLGGLWSRVSGRYAKIRRQNEHEAWQALERDTAEKDQLINRQLEERRELQGRIVKMRQRRSQELETLNRDIAEYMRMQTDPPAARENEREKAKGSNRTRGLYRGDDDLEPGL